MVHSVLLYLNGLSSSDPVISVGVALASRQEARVRGITLVDTRRMESLTSTCESAVYVAMELNRMQDAEQLHRTARADLSQACLDAGLNFEVRQLSGDPLELLPQETQFSDLAIASLPIENGSAREHEQMSASQLVELLFRGVQPLLILRQQNRVPSRVLMVHDGTQAAARAIKLFIGQNLFPEAECRLLAVGATEKQARKHLSDMADYCLAYRRDLELGFARGSLRRVLLPYAKKWQADLMVLGVTRGNRVLSRLLGDVARDILTMSNCALYTSS